MFKITSWQIKDNRICYQSFINHIGRNFYFCLIPNTIVSEYLIILDLIKIKIINLQD